MLILSLAIVVGLLDQLSKALATVYGEVMLNQGVAFGWGLFSVPQWLLGFLMGLLLIILLFVGRQFFFRYPIFTALLVGGAWSNIVDRWVFGGVRDWLSAPFGLMNNLADWAVVIGVLGLLFQLSKIKKEAKSHSAK